MPHTHFQGQNQPSTHLEARIHQRPWSDPLSDLSGAEEVKVATADFSHVDLFSHAPVRGAIQAKPNMGVQGEEYGQENSLEEFSDKVRLQTDIRTSSLVIQRMTIDDEENQEPKKGKKYLVIKATEQTKGKTLKYVRLKPHSVDTYIFEDSEENKYFISEDAVLKSITEDKNEEKKRKREEKKQTDREKKRKHEKKPLKEETNSDSEEKDSGEVTAETLCQQILDAYGEFKRPKNMLQEKAWGEGMVCSDLFAWSLNKFRAIPEQQKVGFAAYSMTAKVGQIDHVALLIAPAHVSVEQNIEAIANNGCVLDLWAYVMCPANDYEDSFNNILTELVSKVKVGNGTMTGKVFAKKLSGQWTISKT